MKEKQKKKLAHLNEDTTEFGTMKFKYGKADENIFKERAFVKVKELIPFINSELKLIQNFRSDAEFHDKI